MESFTVSLAEIPIGVKPYCAGMRPFFADFLSEETPCFSVSPSADDLEYEQLVWDRRNRKSGSPSPLSQRNLERMALLRLIANRLPEYDTILFHGAAVAVDGNAYLFAARSGTGKTTHIRLWLQQLPQAYILNGDKPFLKVSGNDRILVCGTPWRGKERLGCSEILPLKAICILERAKDNRICSVTPKDASQALLHQVHIPDGVAGVRTIHLLNRICREVPLFRLGCNMDPEAAQVSIRAMLAKDCV